MAWLRWRSTPENPVVSRAELLSFQFEGRYLPAGRQPVGHPQAPGIQRRAVDPDDLSVGWSQRTLRKTPSGTTACCALQIPGKSEPLHQRRRLRQAHLQGVPLLWFVGVQPGLYLPFFPVWIIAVEEAASQVAVALEEAQRMMPVEGTISPIERRYAERVTQQRLHQPVFRQRVIQAYETSCAMCRLRHRSLLDAAHILPDRHSRGIAAVSNGLALCKIHHAAFDQNILGIRPDFVIEVRSDILRRDRWADAQAAAFRTCMISPFRCRDSKQIGPIEPSSKSGTSCSAALVNCGRRRWFFRCGPCRPCSSPCRRPRPSGRRA